MNRDHVSVPREPAYLSILLAPLRRIERTRGWRMGEIETWDKSDRWSIGQLKEAVAVPLFAREQGRPPGSPAEALRHYFPMPGEAPDRDEAEPVPSPK